MTAVSSAFRRAALAHVRALSFPSSLARGSRLKAHVGAEGDDSDDPLSRCTSNLSNVDLETGAARKAAFRRAAECVADGYCAQYGVPPGVCSSVAGPVAQAIADSADSVATAFSNGFEIQTSAGPTIAEREAWARRAFGKAIESTRQMHNALFPNDIWTRETQARELWLAETRDVATLRLAEIYSRQGQYGPMPDLERRAREGGADGMDFSFLVYDYSANPGAIVQSDVRAGLNAVTQALVAQAAEERARAQIVQIDPSLTVNLPPMRSPPLSRGQKVARVTLLGGGLWLLIKLLSMIRR